MLQVEAEKSSEIKQPPVNRKLTKEQQIAHATRLIKMGEMKKNEIKALVDERMAGLFKPKINNRPDMGGSQTERTTQRENGEWFGYTSKNNQNQTSRSRSGKILKNPDAVAFDIDLKRRHDMSSKYEFELSKKKSSTLFCRDLSARSRQEFSASR